LGARVQAALLYRATPSVGTRPNAIEAANSFNGCVDPQPFFKGSYAGDINTLATHTRKMEAEDPLEAISGTNGVTGAADAVLVLARGSKGTTLYGRGRDIEEIETAMRFDGGRWSILGDADEVRKSDERRKIVTALKESGEEIGPKAIAEATGMKADNVRKLLGKMVASGEIFQSRVGFYTVPFSKPPEK
jgi:hypothetical protein